jgi:hypothetical protein
MILLKYPYQRINEMAAMTLKSVANIIATQVSIEMSKFQWGRKEANLVNPRAIENALEYLKEQGKGMNDAGEVTKPFCIRRNIKGTDTNDILALTSTFRYRLEAGYPEYNAVLTTEEEVKDWGENMAKLADVNLKKPILPNLKSPTEIASGYRVVADAFTIFYKRL